MIKLALCLRNNEIRIPCCSFSNLTVIQLNLQWTLLVISSRLTPCYSVYLSLISHSYWNPRLKLGSTCHSCSSPRLKLGSIFHFCSSPYSKPDSKFGSCLKLQYSGLGSTCHFCLNPRSRLGSICHSFPTHCYLIDSGT